MDSIVGKFKITTVPIFTATWAGRRSLCIKYLCWSITYHSPAHKMSLSNSNPKGLIFWKGESSARATQSKAEEELFPIKIKEKMPHFFFHKTSTLALQSKAEKELQGYSFSQRLNKYHF